MSTITSPAPIVLVVEDERLLRDLAVDILTDDGFTVLQAADAPEALAMMERGAEVDVLFTDVNMPGEPDGLGYRLISAQPDAG